MSPAEEALAAKDPTFADLCDRAIRARRAHLRAIALVDRLRTQLAEAEKAQKSARQAEEAARDALDMFVDRHCEDEA